MMDEQLNSGDTNEKRDDRSDASASNLPIILDSIADLTEPFTEVNSFSEQISTEDTELSSVDISLNVFSHKIVGTETPVKCNLQKSGPTTTESLCSPHSVEKDQPKPHCSMTPSSVEACTVLELSRSSPTKSKSQERLTTTVHTDPGGDDLCAAVLLACLFCHPLDCLLSTLRGCNGCIWRLCSSFCGCEPLLDVTHHCNLCSCLGVHCFQINCPVCDMCLQATECLDLAMEISQMLYH